MPNIRILAKGVLQIFCSQNKFKIESIHLHLGLYLYAKYQDPFLSGSSDILFTRLFIYKMPMSDKRGINQSKIYGIGSKVNQYIYTLVCTYMPTIRILAKAVLQIFCSQAVVPIQNAYVRKRGITQPKIYEISLKANQVIYILVCNYMPNSRILA